MKQLAEMPVRTLGGLSSILGSYITYSSPLSPIYAALFSGHVEVMRSLLRRAKIEDCLKQVVETYIGIWGWQPLHLATLKRNLPMVKLLLEYGASVSSSTELRAQPAHIAAEVGSMDILAVLFNADASPSSLDVDGHSPLDYLTEYLTKKGGHNDIISHVFRPELLHIACKNDFVGNLKALPSLGARAGGYSPRILQSALDTAIRCGSPSSVQTLLEYGVNPNYCRDDGGTGLHTLVLKYRDDPQCVGVPDRQILRLLLEHVNLRSIHSTRTTVLFTLFHVGKERDALVGNQLARLFVENLPEHKVLERAALRSLIS